LLRRRRVLQSCVQSVGATTSSQHTASFTALVARSVCTATFTASHFTAHTLHLHSRSYTRLTSRSHNRFPFYPAYATVTHISTHTPTHTPMPAATPFSIPALTPTLLLHQVRLDARGDSLTLSTIRDMLGLVLTEHAASCHAPLQFAQSTQGSVDCLTASCAACGMFDIVC
jgi:replication protein A-like